MFTAMTLVRINVLTEIMFVEEVCHYYANDYQYFDLLLIWPGLDICSKAVLHF